MLPCEKCRFHFEENLTKYPLTDAVVSSRYTLVVWLINIHNDVNSRLGKRQIPVEEVIKKYTNNGNNNVNLWNSVLLIIMIILLIIYIKLN
jgi:hypothetical protein